MAGRGISRVGVDFAGGVLISPLVPTVLVNGSPIGVIGTLVASHPPCPNDPSHCAATIITGNVTVLAGGIPVSATGDAASCAHPITPGSTNTLVG